jgi:ribosome-binding protein aMBF1 (putative translation factor)
LPVQMKRYRVTPWSRALRRRLEAWGWTQSRLAQFVEEDVQRVNDWVNGRATPSDAAKAKLVARLTIGPDEVAPEWLKQAMQSEHPVPPAPPATDGRAVS